PAGSAESPSTVVAATSWPGMRGKVTMGFLPRKELRSLPHSPIILTLSNNLSPVVTGSATDSTAASPGFLMTSAFIFRFSPFAKLQMNRGRELSCLILWAARWPDVVEHRTDNFPQFSN